MKAIFALVAGILMFAGLAHGADGQPAAAGASAVASAQVDASDPTRLIQSTAQAMLDELNAHRTEYKKDPSKVNALVDRVLLPYFDTEYAAQRILKRNWRTASPDQRKRFIGAFYQSLLRNYGSALVDFTGDRLKVLPSRNATDTDATVNTQVKRSDGSPVAVSYRLRKTDAGWKAWDVVIEGISYVKSTSEDIGSQVEAQGLDAVIERLESGELKPTTTK